MHSIESLLCNFLQHGYNTTSYVHNLIVVRYNIALFCNREHNKYKANMKYNVYSKSY